MHRDLIDLIDAVLADGIVTTKERAVLHRKAAALGIDADEVDIFVDARMHTARPEAAGSCVVCGASGSMLDRVCTHCGHRIGEPSAETGPDIHASLRRIEEHLAELKSIPLPGSPAYGMQTQTHHLQAQAAFNPFARLMLAGRNSSPAAGQATAGPPDARYEQCLAQIARLRSRSKARTSASGDFRRLTGTPQPPDGLGRRRAHAAIHPHRGARGVAGDLVHMLGNAPVQIVDALLQPPPPRALHMHGPTGFSFR